jgi:transposase
LGGTLAGADLVAVSRKRLVLLSDGERSELAALLRQPANARRHTRARILLLTADGQTDDAIAAQVHADRSTVERIRRKYVDGGLAFALAERPRPGGRPKLDEPGRASLAELIGSCPPAGRRWWTMQLLAEELMARGATNRISDESVRRALHKMGLLVTSRATGRQMRARRDLRVRGAVRI